MAQMFRLFDMGEQNAGARLLPSEVENRRRNRPAEDVVGQHHDDAVSRCEVTCESKSLSNPAGALLLPIGELVAEQAVEVADVLTARYEHQL